MDTLRGSRRGKLGLSSVLHSSCWYCIVDGCSSFSFQGCNAPCIMILEFFPDGVRRPFSSDKGVHFDLLVHVPRSCFTVSKPLSSLVECSTLEGTELIIMCTT